MMLLRWKVSGMKLDHGRIYTVGTVDTTELVSKRHLEKKGLWSWSREEKGQFKFQIGPLLRRENISLASVLARNNTSYRGIISACLKGVLDRTFSTSILYTGWRFYLRSQKQVSRGRRWEGRLSRRQLK